MRPTNEEIEDLALRLEIDYREHRYQNCQRAASMLRRLAVPEAAFTTVEFCGKPAAAPCAIEEQCQYGKDRDAIIEECASWLEKAPLTYAGPDPSGVKQLRFLIVLGLRGLKRSQPQRQPSEDK